MKPRLLVFIALFAALFSVAPAQGPVELSFNGTYLNGDLYAGVNGRLNTLYDFLGTGVNLDIGAFTVTNPKNGAPAAGFSLTYRGRIASNAFGYIGPALKWEQGQRSLIGLAVGAVVMPAPVPDRPFESVWVLRQVDGRQVIERRT